MEPAHFALEEEPLTALRVTVVRQTLLSYQPAFTNGLLVLEFLSLAFFFCVNDRVVASYTFVVSCGLLLCCLGAALLNRLASVYARQQAGEIIFRRNAFILRLEKKEWTLPNDQIMALKLNFSAAWTSPPKLLSWGNSLTIVQKSQRMSFVLTDLPPNTRQILTSLNVASHSVQAPWWEQPTGTFLSDCLSGLGGM